MSLTQLTPTCAYADMVYYAYRMINESAEGADASVHV